MILYFSGTGNSRACAQWLADTLGDDCRDVFSLVQDGIAGEFVSQTPWVFVSPTYSWRLPRGFVDVLRTSRLSGARDAYFVMTCGEDIGAAPRYNRALCARLGLRCRGTLPVVMPENYIAMFSAPTPEEARPILAAARPTLERAAARIRQLISQLPAVQQTIIRMKDVEGYEIGEIAEITGSQVEAIRSNLSRARKKIREQFLLLNKQEQL